MLSVALISRVQMTFAIPISDQTITYQSCWRGKPEKDSLRKNCGKSVDVKQTATSLSHSATFNTVQHAVCWHLPYIRGKTRKNLSQGSRRMPFGKQYSSTLSLTSALDGVGVQSHAPPALPPGKTRYPLYRRLGGPHGRSGRLRKISPPPGFDPLIVQPVTSRCTD
jgi:hypothetical protein